MWDSMIRIGIVFAHDGILFIERTRKAAKHAATHTRVLRVADSNTEVLPRLIEQFKATVRTMVDSAEGRNRRCEAVQVAAGFSQRCQVARVPSSILYPIDMDRPMHNHTQLGIR